LITGGDSASSQRHKCAALWLQGASAILARTIEGALVRPLIEASSTPSDNFAGGASGLRIHSRSLSIPADRSSTSGLPFCRIRTVTLSFGGGVVLEDRHPPRRDAMVSLKILR
jgi:hypothetical protein